MTTKADPSHESAAAGPACPDPASSGGAALTALTDLPADADIGLVVADMDGTLLDAAGEVPATLWPLLDRMRQRGIVFAPASGRQYATLLALFSSHAEGMTFIAENGTFVVRDGRELASTTLEQRFVEHAVTLLRRLVDDLHRDLGVVVCGKRSAWVERSDEAFLAECRRYYATLQCCDDLLAVDDEVLKIAIYDFGDGEHVTAPLLEELRATHQVVVSGQHWIDLMPGAANKGEAVRALQRALDVTPARTAVFGDYLNDLEMMGSGDWSFAMANAHPGVLGAARFVAPANTDEGVPRVLARLLGVPETGS